MKTEPITAAEIFGLTLRLEDPHVKLGGGNEGLKIIMVDEGDTIFGLFWAPKAETIKQYFDAKPASYDRPGFIATITGHGAIGGTSNRSFDGEHRDDITKATLTLFAFYFPDIPELEALGQTFDDFVKHQIEKMTASAEEAAAKVLHENVKRGAGPRGWGG